MLTIPAPHTNAMPPVCHRGPQAGETLRILLVEDDEITQALIRQALPERYTLAICSDVEEAISEYFRFMPDLVFLDINLGDCRYNGFDVLRTIHRHDMDSNVIMISAHVDAENIARAARDGANGFIMKPLREARLLHYAKECERAKRLSHGF